MIAGTLYLVGVRLLTLLDRPGLSVDAVSVAPLFQVVLLGHTGIGLALTLAMLVFLVAHLPSTWRLRGLRSVASGGLYAALGVTVAVTGFFILTEAATRANRWVWWVHVVAASGAVAGYVVHRLVSRARPQGRRFGRFFVASAVGAALLGLAHGASVSIARPDMENRESPTVGSLMGLSYMRAGRVDPTQPFFPSPARTVTGANTGASALIPEGVGGLEDRVRREVADVGYAEKTRIGAENCARCHADVTEQWSSSAHRFASFNNPFYEAAVSRLREGRGTNPWIDRHIASMGDGRAPGAVKSQWCAGCHDPALLLTGRMSGDIGRGEVSAQAGLTCMACHGIVRVHDRTGNGNYTFDDSTRDPYLFADAPSGSVGLRIHDAVLGARPGAHRARLLKPVFGEPEFCATCHKVSLTEPLNDYRWLRGQDEFDDWDDSGVSHNAARTFYLPASRRVCQDCHMPREAAPRGDRASRDGRVRSHRFIAANTALPFVRGDTATLTRVESFLQDEKLRVEVFALKRERGGGTLAALSDKVIQLESGERVTLDVVVRNIGVGHNFPGGTIDSNQAWLELTVQEEDGTLVASSGQLDGDGRLDPLAHVYGALFVDSAGAAVLHRNAQDIRATVFRSVIPPGTADVAHYVLDLPTAPRAGALTVTARLRWRKFNRGFAEFSHGVGVGAFGGSSDAPQLPITEVAEHSVRLLIGGSGGVRERIGEDSDVPLWVRYNDYGIGLLREGNTRMAEEMFARVESLRPDLIEGSLNLARTAIAAGDIEGAFAALERVEATRSGDPRAAWVWGVVFQGDGRYDEAIRAYETVLSSFPRDRATWRNLGRVRFLNQEFDLALEAFGEVLRIDPEDRVAHYYRMLSYRALGRSAEAEEAEVMYQHYNLDEAASERTRTYRLRDPGANAMAQSIRIHTLRPSR
jgi:hypothetical protein